MKHAIAGASAAFVAVVASAPAPPVFRNLVGADDCLQYVDNVDLRGNDMAASQYPIDAGSCWDECYPHRLCRAWTWTDHAGGTCWYKLGLGNNVWLPGAVSGVTYPCGAARGTQYVKVENCDMAGSDAGNLPGASFSDCIGRSVASFTWSDLNGGTCWFKTRTAPCVYAPGKHSGFLVY